MKISYFENVEDVTPKDYDLDEWLHLTMEPTEELEERVTKYRETLDKKIKETLPCVTISASFNGYRNLQNIDQRNNVICIDVDRFSKKKKAKSNPCIDMLLVKEFFMKHPCVYYCGFSVSGDYFGVYALILINNPKLFDKYFLYFQESLAVYGINIDAACKDLSRLRFYSIDKEAYYNPDALYYKMPSEIEKPKEKEIKVNISDKEKIEAVVTQIKNKSIDITQDYNEWIKLASALYTFFGDSGLPYFQTISQFHPDYDYKKTEQKFHHCKKMYNSKISTFFAIASDYGVRY